MSQNLLYIKVISPEGDPLGNRIVKIDGTPIGETTPKGIVMFPADGKSHQVEVDGQQFQLPARMAVPNNLLKIKLAPPPPTTNPIISRLINLPTPLVVTGGLFLVIVALGIIAFALGYFPSTTPTTPPSTITTPTLIPTPHEPENQPPSPYFPPTIPLKSIYFFLLATLLIAGYIDSKERLQKGDSIVAITSLFITIIATWKPLQAMVVLAINQNTPPQEWGNTIAMIIFFVDIVMVLVAAFMGGLDLTAPAMFFGGMGIWGIITGKLGILNELSFLKGVKFVPISQWWWYIKTGNPNPQIKLTTIVVLFMSISLILYLIDLWRNKSWLTITVFTSPIAFYILKAYTPKTGLAVLVAVSASLIVAVITEQLGWGTQQGEGPRGIMGVTFKPSWDIVGANVILLTAYLALTFS